MIKRYVMPVLMALLIGVATLTSFRYIRIMIERQRIVNALEQAKSQLAQLEGERKTLNQKLENQAQEKQELVRGKQAVEDTLSESQRKFSLIEEQLMQAQKRIDDLNDNLAKIEQENSVLEENRDRLTAQVEQLSQEKSALEERLSSVKELKKAIRELRIKMRNVKVPLLTRASDEDKKIVGNRGYIIRNGESTYPAKIKIEVTPAP